MAFIQCLSAVKSGSNPTVSARNASRSISSQKKRKVNEGEVPQYYVEHSHEPIITPEEFDKVQTELARASRSVASTAERVFFSRALSVGTAVPTSARKSGTRPQNTAGSSGNATANSRVSTNAKCRIWTRKPLKRGS